MPARVSGKLKASVYAVPELPESGFFPFEGWPCFPASLKWPSRGSPSGFSCLRRRLPSGPWSVMRAFF